MSQGIESKISKILPADHPADQILTFKAVFNRDLFECRQKDLMSQNQKNFLYKMMYSKLLSHTKKICGPLDGPLSSNT